MFVKMDTCHPVVLFLGEGSVRIADTGSDEFGNATLNQFLGQFRVFQLVAYRHAEACPYQLGQVGVECMEGESRHLEGLCRTTATVGAVSQRDIEYLRCFDSVFRVGLVEIAATEEQHRVGILRLDVAELLHHRCQFFCHIIVNLLLFSNYICVRSGNWGSPIVVRKRLPPRNRS